jgi:16S rRNA (guanine(966)-N(2))-methyltransferase RsmD
VREALFSILGNAVPDRPFYDVFAGTGVVGLEALSRGARSVTFVERDFRQLGEIEHHLKEFGLVEQATLARTDVYRWVERWQPPTEPVNVFLSPPFADYERRAEDLHRILAALQKGVAPASVLALQMDRETPFELLSAPEQWDERHYGRNQLLIWVKEPQPSPEAREPH